MTACPLCGEHASAPVLEVEYDAIWTRLVEERSAVLGDEVIERHTPEPRTTLRACANCGLQYFAPSVPGDAEFYEGLGRAGYYQPTRWEFDVVTAMLDPEDEVLDIGCGRGDFLRQASGRARRVVGVDHNTDAIRHLESIGIEGYAGGLDEYARLEPGRFSVVCAFQLLEHLPSVESLLEPALVALAPHGRLFISVPNRRRYPTAEFEEYDCPPHHISRWDADQFSELARRFGLELVAVRYEEPNFSTAELAYMRTVERAWSRTLGAGAGRLAARACRRYRFKPARYERLAARRHFSRRGIYGHTMLAELRRPGR